MQVQHVQLQQRHGVHLFLQEFQPLEAAGFVYHHSAVAETGVIEDGAAGNLSSGGFQLLESRFCAESSSLGERFYLDAGGFYAEAVGLFAHKVRHF